MISTNIVGNFFLANKVKIRIWILSNSKNIVNMVNVLMVICSTYLKIKISYFKITLNIFSNELGKI